MNQCIKPTNHIKNASNNGIISLGNHSNKHLHVQISIQQLIPANNIYTHTHDTG